MGFAERHSAVNLFLQRSRQRVDRFQSDGRRPGCHCSHLPAGGRDALRFGVSRQLDPQLSCGEIAAEMRTALTFCTTSLRNIPQRHRSLVALFEQTWDRLTRVSDSRYSTAWRSFAAAARAKVPDGNRSCTDHPIFLKYVRPCCGAQIHVALSSTSSSGSSPSPSWTRRALERI